MENKNWYIRIPNNDIERDKVIDKLVKDFNFSSNFKFSKNAYYGFNKNGSQYYNDLLLNYYFENPIHVSIEDFLNNKISKSFNQNYPIY